MTDFETRLKPLESVLVGVYTALFVIGCIVIAVLVRKHLPRLRASWGDNVRGLSARLWTWNDFACVVLPTLVLSSAFGWYAYERFPEGALFPIITSLCLTHLPIIAAAFSIPLIREVRMRDAFGGGSAQFTRDLLTGAALYTAMIACVLPATAATELLMRSLGHEVSPQKIVEAFAKIEGLEARVFIASWTVLIAPIAEELLFRGVLLPLLLRHMKTLPAVALLSLGFALLHFDATAMLPLFIVSICLSLAFIATRSLVVTIAMHALFNSLTTLVLLLTG
jgi:membrane protease YdiL (CAAX protease family)